jgi:glycosyltransferase involved in cell wall biosynthesis
MKIIHCLFTMEAAGAQVLTVGLLNEMCIKNEVKLVIVNGWNTELLKELDPSIKIHYINRKEGNRSLQPLIKLNLLLMRFDADIIHCHEPNMVKIIKLKKKAKLIHTVHDMGIPTHLYNKYDSLVAISDAVYKDVTSKCTQPIIQINNGIPITSFKRRLDYSPVKDTPLKLVQVSRLLHEKKGQDILLRALRTIVKDHGFTNWTLDLIGSGASEEFLKGLTSYLKLQDNVNFVGEKSRAWILNNLCDYHVLIQPSRYEGFGLTIVEGLAAGLPVLASDIDGPKEIINSIPGGFLFENGDIADCSNQLYSVMQLWKKGKIKDIMKTSLEQIQEKYSMTHCADKYIQAYQDAIHQAAAS